jgi:hypothetical protein
MSKSCLCIVPASNLTCKGCPNEDTNNLTYNLPEDDYTKAREYDRLVKFFSGLKNASEDAPYVEVE